METLQHLQAAYDSLAAEIKLIEESIDVAPARIWLQSYEKKGRTYMKITSLNPDVRNQHVKGDEVDHWKARITARDRIAELREQQKMVSQLIDRCCQRQKLSA